MRNRSFVALLLVCLSPDSGGIAESLNRRLGPKTGCYLPSGRQARRVALSRSFQRDMPKF
jgi:hypothetical protein